VRSSNQRALINREPSDQVSRKRRLCHPAACCSSRAERERTYCCSTLTRLDIAKVTLVHYLVGLSYPSFRSACTTDTPEPHFACASLGVYAFFWSSEYCFPAKFGGVSDRRAPSSRWIPVTYLKTARQILAGFRALRSAISWRKLARERC